MKVEIIKNYAAWFGNKAPGRTGPHWFGAARVWARLGVVFVCNTSPAGVQDLAVKTRCQRTEGTGRDARAGFPSADPFDPWAGSHRVSLHPVRVRRHLSRAMVHLAKSGEAAKLLILFSAGGGEWTHKKKFKSPRWKAAASTLRGRTDPCRFLPKKA
ncbi:MAG: hypothetical protein V3S64_06600 [bacterium]